MTGKSQVRQYEGIHTTRLLFLKNGQMCPAKQFFMVFSKNIVFFYSIELENILRSKTFLFWHTPCAKGFLMYLYVLLKNLASSNFHISSWNASLHHQLYLKRYCHCSSHVSNSETTWSSRKAHTYHTILCNIVLSYLCIHHCICLFSLLGTSTAIAEH